MDDSGAMVVKCVRAEELNIYLNIYVTLCRYCAIHENFSLSHINLSVEYNTIFFLLYTLLYSTSPLELLSMVSAGETFLFTSGALHLSSPS